MCVGRLSGLMSLIHDVCMVVSRGLVSFGNLLCSVVAGRSSVARRVSREVRSSILGPVFSPLGSLAMSAFVGEMWRV